MFPRWMQVMRLLKSARAIDDADAVRREAECGAILARLSHEVRQPLTAALAAFHVLAKATDAQRRARAVTVLEQQLGRLARLIDDRVEMERLRLGNTALHLQLIDLRRLIAARWPRHGIL